MPIIRTQKSKDTQNFNIRELDDGTWILGIHSKDDFEEFSYDNPKDLLASLQNEIGSSKDKPKKERTGFKKMMDDDDEGESGHEN